MPSSISKLQIWLKLILKKYLVASMLLDIWSEKKNENKISIV